MKRAKKRGRLGSAEPRAPRQADINRLSRELATMIDGARLRVAHAANAGLTALYWQMGRHLRERVLLGRRAEYGARAVAAVGAVLEGSYGRGFGEKNLRRMVQFAQAFPDDEIVAALLRQLGWTHFTVLIPLQDPLKREFYAELCRAVVARERLAREVERRA